MLKSLSLVAALAAASNAIMIPSTISLPAATLDNWHSLDLGRLLNPGFSSRIVKLDCPDCLMPSASVDSADSSPNSLILDFTVSSSGTTLLLNQAPFYPLSAIPDDLFAYQAPSDVSTDALRTSFEDVTTPQRRIYYVASARKMAAADGTDAQLIDIDFQITGLAEQDITVDKISLRLLRADSDADAGTDGRLTIIDVITVPRVGSDAHAVSHDESLHAATSPQSPQVANICTGATAFLCKWRDVVESKLASATAVLNKKPGCHGNVLPSGVRIHGGPNKFMKPGHDFHQGPPQHHGHEHHGHGHGHGPHRGHHHGARFLHRAQRFLVTIVVPVLVGVAAGMVASLAGMLVGTAIAWAWVRFVRRDRQIDSVAAEEERIEGVDADEKSRLFVDDAVVDSPPVYAEKE